MGVTPGGRRPTRGPPAAGTSFGHCRAFARVCFPCRFLLGDLRSQHEGRGHLSFKETPVCEVLTVLAVTSLDCRPCCRDCWAVPQRSEAPCPELRAGRRDTRSRTCWRRGGPVNERCSSCREDEPLEAPRAADVRDESVTPVMRADSCNYTYRVIPVF